MHKHIITLLAGLLLLSSSSYGQLRPEGRSLRSVLRSLSQPHTPVTRVLSKRVRTSYRTANETINKYPNVLGHTIKTGPSKNISPLLALDAGRLYPNTPFLSLSQKDLTNYFLAQQNRHINRWVPQLHATQQAWLAHIPHFQQAQVHLTHPPQDDITWLAKQIPPNTSYLLLGERHLIFSDIADEVADLLHELRLQQPEREIVLFTEFLPAPDASPEIAGQVASRDYDEVWEEAARNNISVIGLEPDFAWWDENDLHFTTTKADRPNRYSRDEQSIWESLEGVRLRNANWLATLKKQRELSPDALFIIYAGNFHTNARYPFSLGNALQNEDPFIVSFIPEGKETASGQLERKVSWFDEITNGQFDTRVLYFNDKSLRQLAGFDVQIRLPGVLLRSRPLISH